MSSISRQGASRHARDIELAELAGRANPHTLAVLSVPPDSCVLDIGTATGTVAAALHERASRVWAIEIDPEAAAQAAEHCEQMLVADVESVDLEEVFDAQRFDYVLFLDVLEHLRDPVATLRQVLHVLKPGGRVVVSLPNVTHGSVRVQMLQGRFPYTGTGPLHRTQLHFFDRVGMNRLFMDAGYLIQDELPIRRPLDQTGTDVDLGSILPESLAHIQGDQDSEIYQFFVVAAPVVSTQSDHRGSLATELWKQIHELSRTVAEGAHQLADLEKQIAAQDQHAEQLANEIAQRDERLGQAARELARREEASAALTRTAERAEELERMLGERMSELRERESEFRHLRVEISLRERHLVELRLTTAEAQERAQEALDDAQARSEALTLSLHEATQREGQVAAELRSRIAELEHQVAELRRQLGYARYQIADRVSSAGKRVPALHRPAKRAVERLFTRR